MHLTIGLLITIDLCWCLNRWRHHCLHFFFISINQTSGYNQTIILHADSEENALLTDFLFQSFSVKYSNRNWLLKKCFSNSPTYLVNEKFKVNFAMLKNIFCPPIWRPWNTSISMSDNNEYLQPILHGSYSHLTFIPFVFSLKATSPWLSAVSYSINCNESSLPLSLASIT